ncbi:hypothetical protein RSAG8_10558, partial [Rhizoctonia solani AG-8 WAC10335]
MHLSYGSLRGLCLYETRLSWFLGYAPLGDFNHWLSIKSRLFVKLRYSAI